MLSQATTTQSLNREPSFYIEENLGEHVEKNKFVVARASAFTLTNTGQPLLRDLQTSWDNLERDTYYGEKNEGCYRVRRYTDFNFSPRTGELAPRDHVAYFQSVKMNRYVGGKSRHFGDVLPETYENALLRDLVRLDFSLFPVQEEFLDREWICQVHMIRIVVGPGQTTPVTPEGIHSDGYPFAGVHLMNRRGVVGGESSVYSHAEKQLATITFESPLDSLWFEDRNLKHYVTPISSVGEEPGSRDILAISFSLPDSPYTTDV